MESNIDSMQNLEYNLGEQGLHLEKIPFVIQYNKRDLPNAVPVTDLQEALNPRNVAWFEAVAPQGTGVFETLKAIAKLVLQDLRSKA
jgi:signal recognition particle receptor subunit beta